MKTFYIFTLALFASCSTLNLNLHSPNEIGALCVSGVLSKMLLPKNWKKRQSIQIDSQERINFEGIPKMITRNLDITKTYEIKIFWDNKLTSSWTQSFSKEKSQFDISFKPGYWRNEAITKSSKCFTLLSKEDT
jgi:hypothetical protein